MNEIRIPCELIVTPGGSTQQNRLKLVATNVVFDDFESSLSREQRIVAGEIVEQHSIAMSQFGNKLQETI